MKKLPIILLIFIIGGMVMVSGCTSSSDDVIATENYDSDSGVTYGTTDEGYGYAYNDEGDVAVSDGETTLVADGDTGEVYQYS